MENGILYIVSGPIGNLDDITYRAVRTLGEVDFILCEDTRQTRKLLNHYGIKKDIYAVHTHTSEAKIQHAIDEILAGRNAAYTTDSGTPCISDPGWKLVKRCRESGIRIIPIPGPSALAAIASVSGFPAKEIIFSGFLSKKDGRRTKELEQLKNFSGTIIIYESPYRIRKTLESVKNVFPDSEILIGREMTKIFEEFISLKTSELDKKIESIKEKGEFAIAIFNDI